MCETINSGQVTAEGMNLEVTHEVVLLDVLPIPKTISLHEISGKSIACELTYLFHVPF